MLCPLLPGDVAVFGDVTKYATVGDRRIAHITSAGDSVCFDVLGAPGTTVDVRGCSASRPAAVTAALAGETRTLNALSAELSGGDEGWAWDAASGGWIVRVRIGLVGHIQVRISLFTAER